LKALTAKIYLTTNGLRGQQVLMLYSPSFILFLHCTVHMYEWHVLELNILLCGSSQNVDHKRLNFREENFDCSSWDQIYFFIAQLNKGNDY
jgi:hypothetical protein